MAEYMADGDLATLGTKADVASTSTGATPATLIAISKQLSSCLQTLSGAVVALGQATMAASSPVVIASDQSGAGFDFVPKTIPSMSAWSSGNTANADAVCVTGQAVGKYTYLSTVILTASGSTSGLVVTATIIGAANATVSLTFTYPAGVLVPAQPIVINFDPPLVSSATNTPFIITLPAGGSGNTHACASAVVFIQ